jgi:hypothetical protein
MPAKVIPLTPHKDRIKAVVNETLSQHPPHDCPEVVACLKTELEKILEKYFIDDTPELSLVLPDDLSREQFVKIRDNIHQLFHAHNERMVERSNAIFRDLYLSKLEICQLRYGPLSPGRTD